MTQKIQYYETRRQINSILGVEGLNKDGDKYLLMTIDTMEWEEILFFARNHDWFQDGDEIEWNIFNNNGTVIFLQRFLLSLFLADIFKISFP